MKTFYNEFDKFAANWLRGLQAKALITPGHIEERSIVDIKAKELKDYTRAHFFAGIGGWDLALQLSGWPQEVPVWTGSCPCQPFSQAGQGKGVKDERHLWPAFARLIHAGQPPVVFGEQVASKAGRLWLSGVRADLEGMGYEVGAADLCAAGFNAPHIRQRLYWMAYAPGARRQGRQLRPRQTGASYDAPEQVQQLERHGAAGRRLGNPGGASLAPSEPQALRAKGWGQEGRAAQQSSGAPAGRMVEPKRIGAFGASGDRAGKKGPVQGAWRQDPRPYEAGHPSAHGPWSDYYVIHCSDGKARRVGSGLFPLDHGLPHRVGKLRGAGNAIVPIQAATFVRTCMEFLGMAA